LDGQEGIQVYKTHACCDFVSIPTYVNSLSRSSIRSLCPHPSAIEYMTTQHLPNTSSTPLSFPPLSLPSTHPSPSDTSPFVTAWTQRHAPTRMITRASSLKVYICVDEICGSSKRRRLNIHFVRCSRRGSTAVVSGDIEGSGEALEGSASSADNVLCMDVVMVSRRLMISFYTSISSVSTI
jgi:hypothetical protein